MASKEGEENCETEEETIAFNKKRSRRVSFAETTAIHLFVREEDYETPPDSLNKSSDEQAKIENEQIMQLLESSDDSDDNEVSFKGSFIKPMGSPSPASNFGSATSGDEDNFFGPVSTDFIKPRRLSDSAISDENHDITMDSTAFSMHFRSLARSESGGEFKTPTGINLANEDRTPGPISTATSTEDLMVQTRVRKSISSSLHADKVSDSGQSDDMSLVCDIRHRYDYGKLPADLDVLLAEGGKSIGVVSVTSDVESPNNQVADVCMQKSSVEASSAAKTNIGKGKDSVAAATLGEGTHSNSCYVDIDLVKTTRKEDQTPTLLPNCMPFDKDEESRKDAIGVGEKFASPPPSARLNLGSELSKISSFAGSVSSLLAKYRHISKVSADLSIEKPKSIPLANELCDKESLKHVSSMSNLTKSVSRLKRLEAFPFSSTSKAERNASRLTSPGYFTRSKAKNETSGYGSKDNSVDHVDAPVACLEAHFSFVADNNGEFKSLSKLDNGMSREDPEISSRIEVTAKDVELQAFSETLPSQEKSTKIICTMVSPSSTCSQTTSRDKASKSCALSHMSGDGQIGRKSARAAKTLPLESKEFLAGSTTSLSNELFDQVLESPMGKLSCSLLSEKQSGLTDDANMHLFIGNNVATPQSDFPDRNYDKNEQLSDKPRHVRSSSSSSGSKRKYGGIDEAEKKNGKTLKLCGDAFTTFCEANRLLLSPWSDKLDLAMIGSLDDVLIHLEKKKSYELLQHNLFSQKDNACFLQEKRRMDAKLVMYRYMYKKAHLDLMHRKRDKLLEKVQLLNSRVQESETLMSSCRLLGQKNIQVNCSKSESCQTDTEKSLVHLSSLKEESEVSDRKIKHIIDNFHTYFKVTENKTCSQTTEFAKDFLKRKILCRSLQSKLQLYEVETLKVVDGQQNILFDHLGFLSQRFIITSESTSTVSVSTNLNNLKISKLLLSMDINTALSFVLRGDTVLTYTGLRTIAREAQKTSFLLYNFLDVAKEVALAMSECNNLTQSKFCQPSAEKLDLWFCFWNFKRCAKVTLNIDVSCLNRGVYPSQVLPCEVQGRAAGNPDSFQLLLSDIETSVRGLRCKYMRIINLCRCVSKMVQASSG